MTNTRRLGAGKRGDFESFFQAELLPAYKKAKADGKIAGVLVNRRSMGADGRDETITTIFSKAADMDSGNAVNQILGQDAVAKMNAKLNELSTNLGNVIRRRNADLSYQTGL